MKKFLIVLFVIINVTIYAQSLITVDINANYCTFSHQRNKAFVLVKTDDDNYSNNLLQLNPYTGSVEKNMLLNGSPFKMKLTPNHEYLYILYDTVTQIDKVNLSNFQISETIQTDEYHVIDFDILPSNENTLFVVLAKYGYPEKIVKYCDGILQPKQVDDGFKSASAISVKHDGAKLYAHNGISSGHQAYLYDVVEDGIVHDGIEWDYMISLTNIKNHNDLVYGMYGHVVDAFSDSIPLMEAIMPIYKLTDSWPGFDFSEKHNAYVFGHETDDKIYISFFHGQYYNYLGSLQVEGRTDKIADIDVVDQNHFILISLDTYNNWKFELLFYNVAGKNNSGNNTTENIAKDWFKNNDLIKLPFKNDSISQPFIH